LRKNIYYKNAYCQGVEKSCKIGKRSPFSSERSSLELDADQLIVFSMPKYPLSAKKSTSKNFIQKTSSEQSSGTRSRPAHRLPHAKIPLLGQNIDLENFTQKTAKGKPLVFFSLENKVPVEGKFDTYSSSKLHKRDGATDLRTFPRYLGS